MLIVDGCVMVDWTLEVYIVLVFPAFCRCDNSELLMLMLVPMLIVGAGAALFGFEWNDDNSDEEGVCILVEKDDGGDDAEAMSEAEGL
jgi:hypothetical protein